SSTRSPTSRLFAAWPAETTSFLDCRSDIFICAPLEPARRVISGIAICFSPLWKSSRARASNWLIRSTGEPGLAKVGKWQRDESRIHFVRCVEMKINQAGGKHPADELVFACGNSPLLQE